VVYSYLSDHAVPTVEDSDMIPESTTEEKPVEPDAALMALKGVDRCKTMRHWNRNKLCAIAIATTGPKARFHELVDIAVVPIDLDYERDRSIVPFMCMIRPDYPERSHDIKYLTKADLNRVMKQGCDCIDAEGAFMDWKETKLRLAFNDMSVQKQIIPLAHRWHDIEPFLRAWLGDDNFDSIFFNEARDTSIAGSFLSDWCAEHSQRETFNRVFRMSAMCNIADIQYEPTKEAIHNALAVAKLYQTMIRKSVFI